MTEPSIFRLSEKGESKTFKKNHFYYIWFSLGGDLLVGPDRNYSEIFRISSEKTLRKVELTSQKSWNSKVPQCQSLMLPLLWLFMLLWLSSENIKLSIVPWGGVGTKVMHEPSTKVPNNEGNEQNQWFPEPLQVFLADRIIHSVLFLMGTNYLSLHILGFVFDFLNVLLSFVLWLVRLNHGLLWWMK
jgi:hypothetical protein